MGTAVAAFVGLAAQGPFNTPTLVTNWSQFTQTFGEFVERSKLIKIEEIATGAALAKPEKASVTLQPTAPPAPVPSRLGADDYVGDVAARTGFGGLEAVDEITMLAVPDLVGAYQQGVIDAPANEVIRGAIALETQITKAEHDQLNPVGINCLQAFPGRGLRGSLIGLTPDEVFSVQYDRETNPGRGHRRGPGGLRGRGSAGQAGLVRHLPPGAVLRWHQHRQRVTRERR